MSNATQDKTNVQPTIIGDGSVVMAAPGQRFVTPVRRNGYNLWKRGMDIAVAAFFLLLLFPLMLLAAILIKLEDRGPVFFKHKRIGRGGKPFMVFKFRTMCIDAEQRLDALLNANPDLDRKSIKFDNDPRITRIGRIMRKLSIDELPQFINVLRGEMSVVGPRPMVEKEAEHFENWMFDRFIVKPGLTCYWQIMGRSSLSADERMKLDKKYLDEMGFWTDIKIMAKTPAAIFKGEGAS